MLFGLAAFVGLDWGRIPAWLAALAGGALGFAAMGAAIGGLTREVRAASLLAFLLALPIVFLALVPSGSVDAGLYDASTSSPACSRSSRRCARSTPRSTAASCGCPSCTCSG